MPKLSLHQIGLELKKIPGWSLMQGRLVKEFRFNSFPTAVIFINNMVDPVEELDLHPEITVKYNRVTVTIFNHPAGGLTEKDFELAKRIDELA
ncbi:MAG: 4a-hydroxytetrahydrobiopterin dehydratase [Deltaproteobacteria bacterium]|nr:4a-hydroxytetrahydrobiopterin dehydratase [Deltaproteobacteria bacterium]